jgi:alginate O-acetyltransferase complex protein AlgI
MLFSSPEFFAFFAVYFVCHCLVPPRFRIYLIIIGSTIFYAWWKVEYVWLPYLLMGIAFCGAIWIDGAEAPRPRRLRTAATIVCLFLPLVFFKYTNFLADDVIGPFIGVRHRILDLALPLGVSFVTFTLTAYVVDVHRRVFGAVRAPQLVLAYVLFFPHLIAGPILRPVELIPQLKRPRRALSAHFVAGIAIFTLGLVKKLVFADQIAAMVDAVYATAAPSAAAALLAMHGFSVQIYCDFSGYTDMAIGAAMLIGVRLPNNFSRPYAADSIVSFWRRWHITLSFWLRDYLYIPLGGNKGGALARARNILVTMALGGLWHGANWTFVLWGVLHGLGVSFLHVLRGLTGPTPNRLVPRWLGVVITFYFVTFCWVFFRAPSVSVAGRMLEAPFVGGWGDAASVLATHGFSAVLILVFFAVHAFDDHRRVKLAVRRLRSEFIWPALLLLWILAITVSQGSSAKFIYFDF